MLILEALVLVAFISISHAVPAPSKHVLHERRTSLASGWIKRDRIDSSAILLMRIGLTQTNLGSGHDLLMDVFMEYLDVVQTSAKFAWQPAPVPTLQITANIGLWKKFIPDNKGWLAFDASASEAERLFLTEFHELEHCRTSKLAVGCDEYHVPEHLHNHIDYITPGVKHSAVSADTNVPSAASKLPTTLQSCTKDMTPTCLKALYSISDGKTATPGNSLGVFEIFDHYAKRDLDLFYANFAPWVPQGTYPTENLIDTHSGHVRPKDDRNTGESDIDIDIGMSLLYPQTVTLYQVDDSYYEQIDLGFNIFLDALDGSYCTYSAYGETGNDPVYDPVYLDPRPGEYKGKLQCGKYKPTNVISISYGEPESFLPLYYAQRTCDEIMKPSLQGHSILVSSGDFGVAGYPSETDSGCLGHEKTIFNPGALIDCPYITSVGGTMLNPSQTLENNESAMHVDLGGIYSNFTSGGGFSNYFSQPAFQQKAIADYFDAAGLTIPSYAEFGVDFNTTKGLFNRIGRGYPDVSANGAYFPAFQGLHKYHFFGTSLASPIFASILTLINEERFAIGKGPVGFVNPVLYANPGVLNDITNGTNLGCGSDGFAAIKDRWDPVTGLGTPNFPKMLELFLSLP